MGEYRTYEADDEVDEVVGDDSLVGVNDRFDPRKLPEGLCAAATNKSFARGYAETRPGWMTPSWGGAPSINFDPDYDGVEEGISFPVSFLPAGFGTVLGVGQFSDPNGLEANLIATRKGVWRVRNFSEPQTIYLENREKITGSVRFTQAFDRVFMWRGFDLRPMVWNPAEDFTDGTAQFLPVTDSDRAEGLAFNASIPNAADALAFQNRLWIPDGADQIIVSDILDYVHYDAAMSVLRVNAGTDDAIVRLVSYGERAIVVFKRRSGYLIQGTFGDSAQLAFTLTCDRLPGCAGLVGRDAMAEAGTALFFLSDGGIYEVSQTTQSKLQSDPSPITAEIEGTMRRVHWAYASLARMQAHEDRLYCAVPLDGATYNNGVLVYNLSTKKWEGVWTADWLRLEAFLQVTENGRKKLAFVNGAGGELRLHWWNELSDADRSAVAAGGVQTQLKGLTDGALCVMGAGKQDVVYGYTSWIADEVLTRGYKLAPLQQVKGLRLELDLETWNPRFDVLVRRAGRSTEDCLANDVRRGFERYGLEGLMVLNSVADGAALQAGTRTFDGYTISGPSVSWGSLSEILITGGGATDIEIYQSAIESTVKGRCAFVFVGKMFPSVSPGNTLALRVDITDEYSGETESVTLDSYTNTTARMVNVSFFPTIEMLRYPTSDYRWKVSFVGVGTGTGLLQLDLSAATTGHKFEWSSLFDIWHSRRQRRFGKPQVLWTDGSAPGEINERGHDDYAWRVGAGIGSGVVLGATERFAHVYRLDRRGEFLQARVVNERGFSALHGVRLHGQQGRRGKGNRPG